MYFKFFFCLLIICLALFGLPKLTFACTYPEYCDAGGGPGSGQHACTGSDNGGSCTYDPAVAPNCSQCVPIGVTGSPAAPTICRSAPTTTPSDTRNQVVNQNFIKQQGNIRASLQALVPPEVYQTTITPMPTIVIPVQQGLFPSLPCITVPFINIQIFCAAPLNVTNDSIVTTSNQAKILANSNRPENIIPTPAQTDCLLQGDSGSTNANPSQVSGNQQLDQLDQSLGHQGYSANTHPQFTDLQPENFSPTPVNPKNPLNQSSNTDNLNLTDSGGTAKIFNQDLRVPDINVQDCLNQKALYPDSITDSNCQNW